MKVIDFLRLHSVEFFLQGVVDKAIESCHVTDDPSSGRMASKVYSGARMRKRNKLRA